MSTPITFILLRSLAIAYTFLASFKGIPNLSVFFPVDILGWPPAVISGFTLKAIFANIFFWLAILAMVSNSSKDSTLNCSMWKSKAADISDLFFPTPEYTILLEVIPAVLALFNSPIDTISAPAPTFSKIFKIDKFELALTEYAITVLVPFNKLEIFL